MLGGRDDGKVVRAGVSGLRPVDPPTWPKITAIADGDPSRDSALAPQADPGTFREHACTPEDS